ncbi:hypothetical protein [Aquiflexum sp.]|uniref:hypothetical protein n=1 Tax=Aquiflexum sp. TaxID=1872584 RepID=UPI00359355E8
MKTKECPSCAMDVEKDAKFCPICDFHFPKRNPIYRIVALLLALLMLLFFIF